MKFEMKTLSLDTLFHPPLFYCRIILDYPLSRISLYLEHEARSFEHLWALKAKFLSLSRTSLSRISLWFEPNIASIECVFMLISSLYLELLKSRIFRIFSFWMQCNCAISSNYGYPIAFFLPKYNDFGKLLKNWHLVSLVWLYGHMSETGAPLGCASPRCK